MHRLEITGATPDDLYMNAIRMLSVLLKGGAQTVVASGVSDVTGDVPKDWNAIAKENQRNLDEDRAARAQAETIAPLKPKRNARGSKNTEPKILNDEIPDLTGGKTIEHKELTLDGDIRPRLRAIQKACTDRGNDMKSCVAYILQLYGPFGVTKADQLKPEQFAEFLEASEGYLSGEA